MGEARKELLTVTKGERALSLQDKKSTPYLNALLVVTRLHPLRTRFSGNPATCLYRRGESVPEGGGGY